MDLSHTIIATPIDGVVISRNVDVGQTVAASFQAPVLFLIANDLTRMRVNASIDEADVGRVREGQEVTFHVDAFPEREFAGKWSRSGSTRPGQNVVTYNTIVAVDNKELLLRPGMTATVSVIVRKAENALRLPAAALRFRPEGYERPSGRPGGAAAAPAAEQGPGAARARRRRAAAGGRGRGAAGLAGTATAGRASRGAGERAVPRQRPAAPGGAARAPAARPRSSSSTRADSRSRSRSASASRTASTWSCARASRRAPP